MPLTDTAAKNARPDTTPYKMSDSGGRYLLVSPSGSKLWRLDYRFQGKRKTLALGKYPVIGLASARKARDEAKQSVALGIDPSAKRKLDKIATALAAQNTFEAVAGEWLAKIGHERRAAATMTKNRWLLGLAYPIIGKRPIGEIRAPELLDVLRRVETRGRYETARCLRSICGRVFRYAIATGRADRDPAQDLIGAITSPTVTHRAAITEPAEIGQLLRAIDGYDGWPVVRAGLQLLPLTFVRPRELRYAEWKEFDLDMAR